MLSGAQHPLKVQRAQIDLYFIYRPSTYSTVHTQLHHKRGRRKTPLWTLTLPSQETKQHTLLHTLFPITTKIYKMKPPKKEKKNRTWSAVKNRCADCAIVFLWIGHCLPTGQKCCPWRGAQNSNYFNFNLGCCWPFEAHPMRYNSCDCCFCQDTVYVVPCALFDDISYLRCALPLRPASRWAKSKFLMWRQL